MTNQQEHILQYFSTEHLPPNLRAVSDPFGVLAHSIVATLPRNPERTVALRKLLEAKDAAVRAMLSDPHADLAAGNPVLAERFNK